MSNPFETSAPESPFAVGGPFLLWCPEHGHVGDTDSTAGRDLGNGCTAWACPTCDREIVRTGPHAWTSTATLDPDSLLARLRAAGGDVRTEMAGEDLRVTVTGPASLVEEAREVFAVDDLTYGGPETAIRFDVAPVNVYTFDWREHGGPGFKARIDGERIEVDADGRHWTSTDGGLTWEVSDGE